MTTINLTETALDYLKSGLSIIPCYADKHPALKTWSEFQTQPPTPTEAKRWFSTNNRRLAVMGGSVSGNLEILDHDLKAEAFPKWTAYVDEADAELIEKLVIESSPNGIHVIYRCIEAIPGNTKLARKKVEVSGSGEHVFEGKPYTAKKIKDAYFIFPLLIETRGQGGYCVVSPSEGYNLQQGRIENLPVLTMQERNVLIDAARACDEAIEANEVQRGYKPMQTDNETLPGADYDDRGDIRALLQKHGWTPKGTGQDGRERWLRPGKNGNGHSATLTEGKIFYPFSSNATPFEPGRAYGPFAVYTLLEHNGDFSQAAKALSTQGYGSQKTKKPKSKAQGKSLMDLQKKFSTKVEWLWKNHFPRGMPNILNGREGEGKTTIALAVVKDILKDNEAGSILWCATEGFVMDTVHKATEMRLPANNRFCIAEKPDGSYKFDFRTETDRRLLDELLRDLEPPLLMVVIDSIRGMGDCDDNDSKIGATMHKLNAICCDKYGATLLYIDHHKKGRADNLLDKSVGTTAKTAAVRVVLSVIRTGAYTRAIKMAKSNLCSTMPELKAIKMNDRILILEEESQSEESAVNRAEEFLLHLFERVHQIRAATIFETAKNQNISEISLRRAKKIIGIQSERAGSQDPWLWTFPHDQGDQHDQTLKQGDTPSRDHLRSCKNNSLKSLDATDDQPHDQTPLGDPHDQGDQGDHRCSTEKTMNSKKTLSEHKGLDDFFQEPLGDKNFDEAIL